MSVIRKDVDSQQVISPKLDLFAEEKTEVGIYSTDFTTVYPINQPGPSSSDIEFLINGSSGLSYTDLNNIRLNIVGHFVKGDNSVLGDDDAEKLSHVNLLMHSLFGSVETEIGLNQTKITTNDYGLQSYLKTLLFTTQNSAFLSVAGFLMDTPSADVKIKDGKNLAVRMRALEIAGSKVLHFEDTLKLDFMTTQHLFPSDIPIKIKLVRNRDSFYCLTEDGTSNYRFVLDQIFLKVPYVLVNPEILLYNNEQFQSKKEALFNFKEYNVKQYGMAQGSLNYMVQTLEQGVLPRKMFFMMVKSSAMNGNYNENPYFMDNYDMTRFQAFIDGKAIQDTSMDFTSSGAITEAYAGLLDTMGLPRNKSPDIHLYKGAFRSGFTMIGLDLAPNQYGKKDVHHLEKRGTLSVKLTFSKPLPHGVNLVVFSQGWSHITLNASKVVTINTFDS